MGDSLGTVFTIIIAVIVMFFFPMLDSWERQDDLSYMAAYTATVDFVDAVRNTGVLTKEMYESYTAQILGTGNLYDVIVERREYLVVPGKEDQTTEIVYLNHYSSEIEEELYSTKGRYEFNKGDYFYVSIKNRNKTQATMMKETMYNTAFESFNIGVPYGGQVKSSYN